MVSLLPPPQADADSSPVSHFLKTVVLQDWWLIKADNGDVSQTNGLGVAGFTSKDQAVRSFSSAPICRTYDVFTLETVDGITVLLKGFINKSRTRENGFSAQVFKHFVFGFPPYWENYVKFLEGGSGDEHVSRTVTTPEKLVTDSGGRGDFHEGTPNRNKKSVGNLKAANCGNVVLSEAIKKSATTKSKRITRSSHRLPESNQCLDDLWKGTVNSISKVIIKSKQKSCDNLDSSQAAKGNSGLDLNGKQKPAIVTRVVNFDDEDSSQAGDSKNTKKVLGSSSRLSDVNQKDGLHTNATGDSKNTKKVLRNCSRLSDVNQKDGLHTNASSSNKKTKRKLTYEKSRDSRGGINDASSVSPQLSSLKKSRSGRILLPMLEFWRNQTAVYDKEHKLTCIKLGSSDENLSTAKTCTKLIPELMWHMLIGWTTC